MQPWRFYLGAAALAAETHPQLSNIFERIVSAFDHYGSGRGAGMPMTSTQGRSFLDSEVHLPFARYGVGLQEWTLVGIIGHRGISEHVDMNDADFID